MIGATIALYRAALRDAGRAFSRSAMVWPLPIAILVALELAGGLLSQLGLIGGLIHFVLQSWLYGAYLFLVGEALNRRTPLKPQDLRDALGERMREVMSLLFLFWILQLALAVAADNGQISGQVFFIILVVVSILFNPGPEIIHQEQSVGGMDILARAFRWMSTNGPEWVPNLVVTALVLYLLLQLAGLWLGLLICGVLLHPWMLFRGALYRAIGDGSRRSRAWRSRF